MNDGASEGGVGNQVVGGRIRSSFVSECHVFDVDEIGAGAKNAEVSPVGRVFLNRQRYHWRANPVEAATQNQICPQRAFKSSLFCTVAWCETRDVAHFFGPSSGVPRP